VRVDRREDLYEGLLQDTTLDRPEFDRAAIAAALNLAFTYDVQQSVLWKGLSYGLARSSFNLLAILRYTHPEGLQLSEIGELLITSRANITGIVDHLEQKGYVKRVIDPRDRRVRIAQLTKSGETLLDEVMPRHKDRLVELFSNLTLEEIQTLIGLLKKVRRGAAIDRSEKESDTMDPVFCK
jgi:MarR family 2-MHQ and catechol resistance regulon transcriptional repressor